jgi:hypothetical protein
VHSLGAYVQGGHNSMVALHQKMRGDNVQRSARSGAPPDAVRVTAQPAATNSTSPRATGLWFSCAPGSAAAADAAAGGASAAAVPSPRSTSSSAGPYDVVPNAHTYKHAQSTQCHARSSTSPICAAEAVA